MLNGPGSQTSFGPGLGNVQRANSMTGSFGTSAGPYGTITPAHRLKYNQMFKANDYKKAGFISGNNLLMCIERCYCYDFCGTVQLEISKLLEI